MVERIRIPFITPEMAEVTNAATMIMAMMVHVVGLETMLPLVRLLVPSATRKIADPILAAIPHTRAKRQIQSTTGEALSAILLLNAGKSMVPMEYFFLAL